jgi:hypothetical protein
MTTRQEELVATCCVSTVECTVDIVIPAKGWATVLDYGGPLP